MKTLNIKKVVTLATLALTPAFALTSTSSAQAAPAPCAPVSQRGNNNNVPAWNNNSRNNAPAWNNSRPQAPRYDARSNQGQRYDARPNAPRVQNTRNDQRFDARRDNNNGRNKSNGSDTTKIIGAGIVGAILGAVLSR